MGFILHGGEQAQTDQGIERQLERDQHATSRPRNNNMLENYGASRNGFRIYAD